MLSVFDSDLRRCAICHDQCLFATVEVFASGRQTLATSRKAMLIEAVRHGTMTWTPRAVEVMYSGLSSGVQHATCVNCGDPAGWPDETLYLRAARAAIVAAGLAPQWAVRLCDTWRRAGDPYGLGAGAEAGPGTIVFLSDAASRAFLPAEAATWAGIADELGISAGQLAGGSSGFELFDLGFVEEARQAAALLAARLMSLSPEIIVSDSPEAVYMIAQVWPKWGLTAPAPVRHASEWLAAELAQRGLVRGTVGAPLAFHDPSCLARYLDVLDAPREVCRRLGVLLVEMLRHGVEALPSGSYYGDSPGAWLPAVRAERVAAAAAVGATGIVTASPFDYRNLRDLGLPVVSLGQLAAAQLGAAPSPVAGVPHQDPG